MHVRCSRTNCRLRCGGISRRHLQSYTRMDDGTRRRRFAHSARKPRLMPSCSMPFFARRDLSTGLVSDFFRKGHRMTRDFVGYGAEPPHAQWPGDARVAVNFVINFEEGSELSYPSGDGVSEGGLTEMLGADLGVHGRDLAAESMFEYGARVGFWRLHRIFTRFKLPVTIFGCAKAFEANPPAAAAIAAADWDICS